MLFLLAVCDIKNGSHLGYADFSSKKIEKISLTSNIKFIKKFLSQEEVQEYLQACDILLAFYRKKDEAFWECVQSGFVGFLIAAEKPIIATNTAITRDLTNYSYTLEITASPEAIVCTTKKIIQKNTRNFILKKLKKKYRKQAGIKFLEFTPIITTRQCNQND